MLINELPYYMGRALFLTIIIEGFVALLLGVRDKKDFLNVALVNLLTNPLVVSISVFFNLRYGLEGRRYALIVLEIWAFFMEGFVYHKCLKYKKINPYLFSILLNMSSYLIGEVINYVFT